MTAEPATSPVLLRSGTVFDGHDFIGRLDVLLDVGLIAAVGNDLATGPDVNVIDCRDHTVMPGLIDAHVHVAWAGVDPPPATEDASLARAVANVGFLLQAGVTTVRDVGGPAEVLDALARGIAGGDVSGPDVLHCGRILCAPGGHGTEVSTPVTIAAECDGPEGFRRGVRAQVAAGARWIKVALNGADGAVQLTEEELVAVIDEAHSLGIRVACHASVHDAVAMAVQCGVDTVEHGNGLDVDLAQRMADGDIALIPTVAIFTELGAQLDGSDDSLLSPEQTQAYRRALTQRLTDHATTMSTARAAAVSVGLGTDRVPGGDVVAAHAEARVLAQHGLTNAQVLEAATAGNARALRLDDRGVIRVGARADIAIFAGDLADDLDWLQRPQWVIKAGDMSDKSPSS